MTKKTFFAVVSSSCNKTKKTVAPKETLTIFLPMFLMLNTRTPMTIDVDIPEIIGSIF